MAILNCERMEPKARSRKSVYMKVPYNNITEIGFISDMKFGTKSERHWTEPAKERASYGLRGESSVISERVTINNNTLPKIIK